MKKLLFVLALVSGAAIAGVGGSDQPLRDPYEAPEMVTIPAPGSWTIGSPVSEEYRDGIETELAITVDYTFRISTTEVTEKQYRDLRHEARSSFGRCDDCPANNVSWYEATDYLDRLSAKEGLQQCYGNCLQACSEDGANVDFPGCWKPCYTANAPDILSCTGYRLPTASEFEWVSRGGGSGSGLDPTDAGVNDCTATAGVDDEAWFCATADDSQVPRPISGDCASLIAGPCVRTQPVASKSANAYGVYDIKGNLYEWVHDYQCNPRSDTTNPTGESAEAGCLTAQGDGTREKRGGSLKEPIKHQRPAQRSSDDPERRQWNIGFRAALNGDGT